MDVDISGKVYGTQDSSLQDSSLRTARQFGGAAQDRQQFINQDWSQTDTRALSA
jgi:hypothetical protein